MSTEMTDDEMIRALDTCKDCGITLWAGSAHDCPAPLRAERDELREALREARKWLNPVPTFEAEERVREMIDRLLSRPEAGER